LPLDSPINLEKKLYNAGTVRSIYKIARPVRIIKDETIPGFCKKKSSWHIFREYRTLFIIFGIPVAQIPYLRFCNITDVKNAGVAFLDYRKMKQHRN